MRVAPEALLLLLSTSSNAYVINRSVVSDSRWGSSLSSSQVRTNRHGSRMHSALLATTVAPASRSTPQMLVLPGGSDAFKNIIENSNQDAKIVRKVPAPLRKVVSVAAVPAAAVGGFLLTPSRRAIAGVVGGALSGVIGSIGKDRLDSAAVSAALPALAQVLLDNGIEGQATMDSVQKIQTNFGVSDEEFETMCTEVYRQYLVCMCNDPTTKTGDITELNKLASTLRLSNLSVGEAHAEAARDIFRLKATWTPEDELADPEHPDRMSIDKFLFLTERALRGSGETEEAFTYEMSRVSKAFGLSTKEIQNRCSAISKPFYLRALSSTRSKIDTGEISSDMLQRARNQLGINDWAARDMHISTYSNEVRSLLGTDKENEDDSFDAASLAFPEGAFDRLQKLKDVLGLSDEDANYEIETETTPLFQATASSAFARAIEDSSQSSAVWDEISARQAQLGLSDEVSSSLVGNIAVQAVGEIFEEAVGFAKVNNAPKTMEVLDRALATKESVVAMLASSGNDDEAAINEKYFDANSQRSAVGFIPYPDRLRMYQIYYSSSLKKSKGGKELSAEQEENLSKFQVILGIEESTVLETIKNTCGPIVKDNMVMACKDILGPEYDDDLVVSLKKENEKLISNLRVPDSLVESYTRTCYSDSLGMVQNMAPGGIPGKEYVDKLAAIRDFLNIEIEEVHEGHLSAFGPAYKKSVVEAMGATGIIRPEFREPLSKLRMGLGVTEEAAESLFHEAVSEKMKPIVQKLVNEMERTLLTTQQLSQKRGMDMGEDMFQSGKPASGKLGIGAAGNLIGDCMNLVDFYQENDIGKKQVGMKSVEKKVKGEDGEEITETVEEPEYEQTFPVTALEIGGCDDESAEQLFRQFLVTCFTEQGPNVQRYEAAAPTFGSILGFDAERQEEISSTIGTMIYENYVNNVMRTKPSLDQQDMMFLANIQTKLNLSSEKSQELLVEAQKKNLRNEATNLFADLQSASGASLKAFRERCNSMGIDLQEDLNVSGDRLKAMLTIEMLEGINNGSITPESGDMLTEIQDSLGLTSEECEDALQTLITNLADGTLKNIGNEFRRGRDERAADEIKNLIKYASFLGGDLDLDVSDDMGQRIRGVYDSMDFTEDDKEKVEEDKEILLGLLGMYV